MLNINNKLTINKISNHISYYKRSIKINNKLKQLCKLDTLIKKSVINNIKMDLYNLLKKYKIKNIENFESDYSSEKLLILSNNKTYTHKDLYNLIIADLKELLNKDFYIYICLNDIMKLKKYKTQRIHYILNENILNIFKYNNLINILYDYNDEDELFDNITQDKLLLYITKITIIKIIKKSFALMMF